MKALFYDSETTGLPLWRDPSEDPRQPRVVQLGAILADLDTHEVHATLDVIVRPDGWEIPAEAAAIHGITTEHALKVGLPAHLVLPLFFSMWWRADVRIGHNESFDARMLRIAIHRHGDLQGIPSPDEWKAGIAECTQAMATPLLNLPPTDKMLRAGFTKPKSATLKEAHRHLVGAELEGAHSAIVDARGCMAVYFAIKAKAAAVPT